MSKYNRKTLEKRRPRQFKSEETKQRCLDNLVSLADRTPEERREIALKSAEVRRKKREYRNNLQNAMRTLLTLPTNSNKKKQILKDFGFEDEEQTNATLLMVALFQKALTGDMSAIRDITRMAAEFDQTNTSPTETTNGITINIIPADVGYTPTPEDKKKLWDVENNMNWTSEDDEEWGTDTYEPKSSDKSN